MTPKEAASLARAWVADVFADDDIANLGLEEIRFDDPRDQWLITVGFDRFYAPVRSRVDAINKPAFLEPPRVVRSYKVVRINNGDGAVVSVEERQIEPLNA